MSHSHFQQVIVGQGLAGTALAWQLCWRGQRVLVIDRQETVTSSKVAAGLITPVTGQRLVSSWRFEELWPAAVAFYRRVESETISSLFREAPMVRLVQSDAEAAMIEERRRDGTLPASIHEVSGLVDEAVFRCEYGAVEMRPAGQLDVPRYMEVSRAAFQASGEFITCDLDWEADVVFNDDGVELPRLGVRADSVVSCEGIAAQANPFLADIAFRPAKGEVLTVRIPGVAERRIVHRGVWLVPLGGELYRAGATYEWTQLDSHPTPAGREEIERQLRDMLLVPFEVIGHQAAVRPIHLHQLPVMGFHPRHRRLSFLNGFGSKGTLQSPLLAQHLAELLTTHFPPNDLELSRLGTNHPAYGMASNSVTSPQSLPIGLSSPMARTMPLTEKAHEIVKRHVREGDCVIDATAGNGHDTEFLARQVGPDGKVLAFDIQPAALERTAARLEDKGLSRQVTLIQKDHSRMAEFVPDSMHGVVSAVMFNLGYLPHGDKSIITRADTTSAALSAALDLIKPHGVVTVLAYCGHAGGGEEASAVESVLIDHASSRFALYRLEGPPPKRSTNGSQSAAPRLFVVIRQC